MKPSPRNSRPRTDRDGKHRTQAKPNRASKRTKVDHHESQAKPPQIRYQGHPLYGNIPLIPKPWLDRAGKEHVHYEYDPSYLPLAPKGAVRGDIRLQRYCGICSTPRYFYTDEARVCVQCKEPFIFGAAEQKYWYETLQFNFYSLAIRCAGCRRKRRTGDTIRRDLAAAKAAVRLASDDPAALFAFAEALVRYRKHFAQGSLPEAIAAARKAARILRGSGELALASEGLFWEASCHALAERGVRARELFQRFLDEPRGGKRLATLAAEAKRQLLGAPPPSW